MKSHFQEAANEAESKCYTKYQTLNQHLEETWQVGFTSYQLVYA